MDSTITEQDITRTIVRATGTDKVSIIFTRLNHKGILTACVVLPRCEADGIIKKMYLTIGWGEARLRNCTEENRCFRCGEQNHKANACKRPTNVCYKCKEPGHQERECTVPEEELEEEGEERGPELNKATNQPTNRKNRPATEPPPRVRELAPHPRALTQQGSNRPPSIKEIIIERPRLPTLRTIGTQTDTTAVPPATPRGYAEVVGAAPGKGTEEQRHDNNKNENDKDNHNKAKQTEGRTAARRPRGEAIMVRIPGTDFAETLRRAKENLVLSPNTEVVGTRCTRGGYDIIQLSTDSDAKAMVTELRNHFGDEATVRILGAE